MPLINLKQTLFGVCAPLGRGGLSKGPKSPVHRGFKEGAGSTGAGGLFRPAPCLDVGPPLLCLPIFSELGWGLTEVVFQSHLMVPWGLLATDFHVSGAFVD